MNMNNHSASHFPWLFFIFADWSVQNIGYDDIEIDVILLG